MDIEALIKADVFFFITSISVILVSAAVIAVAYFIGRAAKEIELLSKTIREEVEDISDEVSEVKKKITSRAWMAVKLIEFITSTKFWKNKK